MAPAPIRGRKGVAAVEGGLFSALSEIHWTIDTFIVEGDRVALEFRVTALNSAALPTPQGMVPATHRRVEVRGASILRMAPDNCNAEERRYFDLAAMFAQLGLKG